MKFLLTFILVVGYSVCTGQVNFHSQLRQLVSGASNNFAYSKGSFMRLVDQDSLFTSLVTLEGTKKNEILSTATMIVYMAAIIDSVKERQGRKIIDEWKEKLNILIQDGFLLKQLEIVDWNPGIYGWKFIKGDVWVNLTLYPYSKKSSGFWADISISGLK